MCEVFLHSTIDENNSKCTLTDDEIVFELQKTIPQKWDSLTADVGKMEMLEKRKEIFDKQHQKTEEERKAKKEKTAGLRRFAVQQQIERDTINRRTIDERRNEEKSKAMDELEEWKNNEMENILIKAKMEAGENPVCEKEIFLDDPEPCPKNSEEESGDCAEDKPLIEKTSEKMREKESSTNIFPIPLPRTSGTVTIHFTHRDFPTPSRESQAPQEEEWLKKQVEARRATGFVAEDLRPEECNPSWLKEKGE